MLKKIIRETAALTMVLILAGCATTINLGVERPPALNTSGIKRIAIMPFEAANNGPNYREMGQYATSIAVNKIHAMNYFTLVDHSEIERFRKSNQNIENYVDALFNGRITRVDTNNYTRLGSYKNKKGETITYTTYYSDVEIEFNYSLVRARDGSIIGPVFKKGSRSSSSQESYPSNTELLRSIIDDQLRYVGRDLAPHTVIESRTFASDKSKDKVLKKEMKDALAFVKEGSYKTALEAYLGIYEQYKSIAAAENASNLYEVFGNTRTAADFMRQAYDDTGNPRAREVLARLDKILRDQATIANEYDNAGGQTDKIAAFACDEILKILPKGASVWIHNNSPKNVMTAAVVDNITASFIRNRIAVVDRENAALIEAEQNFQLSGNVSDNDIINIGNAAGANTIVIIGITGTGAMRRLQVRVLDIERRIPIMQSDTGERWQL